MRLQDTNLPSFQDKPAEFMLTNENGGNRSTVTISAKYVPVPIKLEMRETVNSEFRIKTALRARPTLTNLL